MNTIHLPPDTQLTFTAGAERTGKYWRLSNQPGGEPLTGPTNLAAGQSKSVGPFSVTTRWGTAGDVSRVSAPLSESGAALTGEITKTLKTSGGDFSSMDEVVAWLNANTFAVTASVTIDVSAGTYTMPIDAEFRIGGPMELTFRGADEATCIFEFDNTEGIDDGFDIFGVYAFFQRFTFQVKAASTAPSAVFYCTGARVLLLDCTFIDCEQILYADLGSSIQAQRVTVTAPTGGYDGEYFYIDFDSWIKVRDVTIDGIDNSNGTGFYFEFGSRGDFDRDETVLENLDYGVVISGKVSLFIDDDITFTNIGSENYYDDYEGEALVLDKFTPQGSLATTGAGGLRKSGAGETTGFTARAGTAVLDDSTFTGNIGSTAYRVNDVVKALKQLGLLAD